MIAVALEIGVYASFSLHNYTFGGSNFRQKKGGPIGARLAMAVSRVIMEIWRRLVRYRLQAAGVRIYLEGGYVDEMRHLLSLLEKGLRWNKEEDKFIMKEEPESDEDNSLSQRDITAREVLSMMNCVLPFLTFTKETQEELEDNHLPTLDTAICLQENGYIRYKFYEKPMSSRY